jgi:branched-chain amino acid transport system permease protein
MGVQLSVDAVDAWVGAVFLILTGGGLFELARRHFVHQWSEVQEEIEAELLRRQLQ